MKRNACFYALLLSLAQARAPAEEQPACPAASRGAKGGSETAVPDPHLPPEGAGQPGPCAQAALTHFVQPPSGSRGRAHRRPAAAVSTSEAQASGFPGARRAVPSAQRVSCPAAWEMCLNPWAVIRPYPHRDGTCFSSRNSSEIIDREEPGTEMSSLPGNSLGEGSLGCAHGLSSV